MIQILFPQKIIDIRAKLRYTLPSHKEKATYAYNVLYLSFILEINKGLLNSYRYREKNVLS